MKVYRVLILLMIIGIILPMCSAAHYITGFVEDALDSTGADGHTIILWNETTGIQDNLTDTIGPSGSSGINNEYRIDCELLGTPCNTGDILTLKVINNGDGYVSEKVNVTVTASSEDSPDNVTLNSPPTTDLIFPGDFENISNSQIDFNCSVDDLDGNLQEVSLYGSWTGDWELNETKQIGVGEKFIIFTKNLLQGIYKYNCEVTDNLSISSFYSQNKSFTVDLTDPVIDSVLGNLSYSCGDLETIRVNCTTYDGLLNIDKVIIQAISPSGTTNYSTSILTGDTYYTDILLNELGSWRFNCIANDSAGNTNNLSSGDFLVYSDLPDLIVNFSSIGLSEQNPIEGQSVKINAVIENLGCSDAENALIGFFEGDPDVSGENIDNSTVNVSGLSSSLTNVSWNVKIGPINIFVFADLDFLINEENESNNKANKTFPINSWQEIYGNTSIDKILGEGAMNISAWSNETALEGNIFVTDSECSVDWLSLQAIGKTKIGGDSSNDFSEIDELLNMTTFEDSVSNVFSNSQIPKDTQNILVYQKQIQNVPIINSTEGFDFVTGILWDSSDDDLDGEFDSEDGEDLVFVAPIKKNAEGGYGFYDYEIKIPSKLREYKIVDTAEVYLYYDLN